MQEIDKTLFFLFLNFEETYKSWHNTVSQVLYLKCKQETKPTTMQMALFMDSLVQSRLMRNKQHLLL